MDVVSVFYDGPLSGRKIADARLLNEKVISGEGKPLPDNFEGPVYRLQSSVNRGSGRRFHQHNMFIWTVN